MGVGRPLEAEGSWGGRVTSSPRRGPPSCSVCPPGQQGHLSPEVASAVNPTGRGETALMLPPDQAEA